MSDININVKIKNIPSAEDYFERSYELFIESFESLLLLMNVNKEVIELSKSSELFSELRKKDAIEICTKLHHVSEIYLSGLIAESNPLDLIQINNLSKNEEIDFDDCLTIPANQLLNLAIKKVGKEFFKPLFNDVSFKDGYERNRKIRNKNMHSLVRNFDFDVNEILKDFLTLWFVLFRKREFIKDLYKIVLINYYKLESTIIHYEETQKDIEEIIDDVLEGVEIDRSMICHKKRVKKRRLLFKIIFLITNILNKEEFKKLFNIDIEMEKKFCYCPNCEVISRIHYFKKSINYNDIKYGFQPKTLIVEKGQEKAFCYLCGLRINRNRSYKEYCKKCNQETYFVNHKIKKLRVEDSVIDVDHDFCLYCGEIRE